MRRRWRGEGFGEACGSLPKEKHGLLLTEKKADIKSGLCVRFLNCNLHLEQVTFILLPKNKKRQQGKLEIKKYDPKARKHVLYTEKKLSK